ncbi:MAG: arsenate reductase ArsC, partial [Deltaproteobacteria bacterium]
WELEDPAGKSLSVYRRVRDQVEARVKELVDRWGR